MDIKSFIKERRIWVTIGNVKSLYTFNKNDKVCFSQLPNEFTKDKELYNLYILNDGLVTSQIIVDKKTKDDLSKDLSFIKKASKLQVDENLISESLKIEKPTKKSKTDSDLSSQLIVLANKVEKKYVGKQNLIANAETLTEYLTKFSESLRLVDDFKEAKKNTYIKTKNDVIIFLKEELPDLTLINNFPPLKEPFIFLNKLEIKTLKDAMSAKSWIEEKDLSMIAVAVSDGVDIIKIGVDFSNFEFVKACEGIIHLDTAVRENFESDLYDWKNDFQKLYYKDISLGHEYEKTMKMKFELKNDLSDNLKQSEKIVKKVKI